MKIRLFYGLTPLTRHGGSEVQARGVEKGVKAVGMSGPEGQDLGSPGRQDNGSLEAGAHLVQDFASIHGLRPRFNGWQLDGAGLGVVAQFGPGLGDLGIKGLNADVKAFCLGVAQTVVLGG